MERVPGSSAIPTTAGYLKSAKTNILMSLCSGSRPQKQASVAPNQTANDGLCVSQLVCVIGLNCPPSHSSGSLCFTKTLSGKGKFSSKSSGE